MAEKIKEMKPNTDQILKQALAEVQAICRLPEGHAARFAWQLAVQEKRRRRLRRLRIGWISTLVAASLVILFILIEQKVYVPEMQTELISETVQVSEYYGALIDEEKDRISVLLPVLNGEARQEISADLKQMSCDEKEFVRSASGQMAADEQIAFLVMCYKRQLESLKLLRGQLQMIVKH